MILVSACLLGLATRYNGDHAAHSLLMRYSTRGKFIPFCPEQLGGLATPRQPVELAIQNGQVKAKTSDGQDVTEAFYRGVEQSLWIADVCSVTAVIAKERSPSCGVHQIYDGNFQRRLVDGMGLTTDALRKKGIPVYSEEDLTEEILQRILSISRKEA